MTKNSLLGVVIIGRNEGERLIKCIQSAREISDLVVYVDSGSADTSVERARELGCLCIELDMAVPFTAARARNVGWRKLAEKHADVQFVHFVDGDCEIISDWVEQALQFFAQHDNHAVVCGRRVERYSDRSIYNRLCDIEWNTPVGEAKACGGDAIIRVSALQAVNGYRDDFIAGEEPEMCLRMRKQSWKIERIDADMTIHDAAMTTFSQWWKRSKRAGFAFALGAYVHGADTERHWVKETLKALVWGGVLPFTILMLSAINAWFLLLIVIYPVQWYRLTRLTYIDADVRAQWSFFIVLGKFAEFTGVCEFYWKKITKRRMHLIEYK